MNSGFLNGADVLPPSEAIRVELEQCRRDLAECHRRMHQMEGFFNHVADAIFIAEPDGKIIDANPAASALLGYSKEELLVMESWAFAACPSRETILDLIKCAGAGTPAAMEQVYRGRNGDEFIVEVRVTACNLGRRDLVIVSCRDATQRKWAEALLAGERRLLELVARDEPLHLTLETVCKVVEGVSVGSICSILLMDPKGERLVHGAAPSLPSAYIEAINGRLVAPCDGPCATAAVHRKTVIVPDVGALPPGAEYRELALSHGLRACWSTPILSSENKVLGTFAIYSRTPGSPTPRHYQVIEQITHLSAVAIERKCAENALRRSEAYLAEAQQLSVTGSFGWKVSSGEIVWSRETYRIMEVDASVKPTLSLGLSRVHPLDLDRVRLVLDRVVREMADLDVEHRLLLPSGAVKHVHVVARPTKGEGDTLEFIGSIMDVTGREKAEEALRASERLARGQVETLKHTLDVMSMESNPDRLVEHVLRTITSKLDGHSSSVWLLDEARDLMVFEFALEDGRLKSKRDPVLAAICPESSPQAYWPWPEVARTGRPQVLEDLREGPDVPWRSHLLQQGIITILVVPLQMAGKVAGVIGIRFTRKRNLRSEELELAQALANQAMLAIQLIRLSARDREAAVAAERNRMARDIHDTLAQGFTGVIVQLEAAEDAMSQGLVNESNRHLEQAADVARESLKEARRSVQALRPLALEEKNLCDALEELMQKMTAGTSVQAQFLVKGESRRRPPDWDDNLLRIGQEVLTNALRHAHATVFKVSLIFNLAEIRLELSDNGAGFDPARRHDGFGLRGIRERVESMGGQLSIQSGFGNGTSISIILPLAETSSLASP